MNRIDHKSWSQEETDILVKIWNDETSTQSAYDIGEILGRGRNSIIGKAHRLKLSSREWMKNVKNGRPRTKNSGVKRKRMSRSELANVAVIEVPEPGPPGGVHIYDLTASHCRYPREDKAEDGLAKFCGASRHRWRDRYGNVAFASMCVTHYRLCYVQRR